jgi:phage-related protein
LERIGIVHEFIKKTRKTPEADLELTRERMNEMNR